MTNEETKLDYMYDYLTQNEYFTEDEIQLVTCINGWNEESFNDMIYARYGYRDFEQFKEYVK